MLRLLIIGNPGTPCFEVADRLSEFHELEYLEIKKIPDQIDSYFQDDIPEATLDTGDFISGSESQHMARDPRSLEYEKEISEARLGIPDFNDSDRLNPEELAGLDEMVQGIVATEIPDLNLVKWATHVSFFKTTISDAVNWFNDRRHCPSCKSIFHLQDRVPQVEGICDRCGTELVIRPEDKKDYIKERFKDWENSFWKMEQLAKDENKLKRFNVDEIRDFDELTSRLNLWVRGKIEDKRNWWAAIKDYQV